MKAVRMILCMLLVLTLLCGCGDGPQVEETINGPFTTYERMSDGTWRCEGYTYAKKLVITGRMPNAAVDSTFVYLTNLEDITFTQAYLAAGISSSTDDYFSPEDDVLVDMMTGQIE